MLFNLILNKCLALIIPILMMKKERFRDLTIYSKVTHPLCGGPEIRTQICLTPKTITVPVCSVFEIQISQHASKRY